MRVTLAVFAIAISSIGAAFAADGLAPEASLWNRPALVDGQGGPKEALCEHGIIFDAWLTHFYQGRVIPLNRELRSALQDLRGQDISSPYVIKTERSGRTSASAIVNLFAAWYHAAGLQGCSSHSGRRTFITNAARTISTFGGSLRDVQMLDGHSALSPTERYIEADAEAQKRVVDLV